MKIFVTALLAASLALAQADISLTQAGYNYRMLAPPSPIVAQLINQQLQQQQQHQHQQLLPPLPYLPPASTHYQPQPHRAAPNAVYPMPANFPINFQTAPAQPARRARPRVRMAKKPIVTKNFFIHAAPEESEEEVQEELAQLAQQPRNHYNVLFVKTPSQTNRAAALNLAKTLKQEKTVVYVLAKKTTAADLQDAIAEAPQHINKPEVFFIKYRTPEEAANAQRQIQTQYDALGGSSTITDEGVAPSTSVIGSLDAPEEEQELEQPSQQASIESMQSAGAGAAVSSSVGQHYLPANQF